MVISVMVRRPLELTRPQVELLRFFAGEKGPPGTTRKRTCDVLLAHDLVKKRRSRGGYVITDLGRRVLDEVDRSEPA
jgi:hypothetical protein